MNRLLELQQKLADDTARSDIECECIPAEKDDLGQWYMARPNDPEMADVVAVAIEYLTFRGLIMRHPVHDDWVRVDVESELDFEQHPSEQAAELELFGYFWEIIFPQTGEVVNSGFERTTMQVGEFPDPIKPFVRRVRALVEFKSC